VKESRAAFIIFLRNVERNVSVWNLKRTQINEYEVTAGRTCYECSNIQYRDIKEHCEIPREGIPFSPTDKEVRRTNSKETDETKRSVGNCQEFLRYTTLTKISITQNSILNNLTKSRPQ